jgi:signal transduction histidine kinase
VRLDEPGLRRAVADTLLRSMAEGVLVLDADLRVVDTNVRWCELVGLPRERVLGCAPPYPWQAPGPASGVVDRGTEETCVRRSDGSLVPVLARRAAVPGDDGAPDGYVAMYLDLAARPRPGELAQQAALLERVNEHLRRTNVRLEREAGFKSDLTALLSHEVSQPLTSIASLAELLADGWEQLPEDTRLNVTHKIHHNARRLVDLVRDMLLLFQLDSGTVTARRTAVMVTEVAETLGVTTPIELDIEPTTCALVDRAHLETVLAKLVANAVAYGEAPVVVTGRPGQGEVVLTVTDHGRGIPEDLRRRLFDRTVPPSTAAQGSAQGRGLGLFITRHLVEANGGTIWYAPVEPSGACLGVRLESAPLPAIPR